jgi:hypothetical protein
MKLPKVNRPICSPTNFLSKSICTYVRNLYLGKKSPQTLGYFSNFYKNVQSKRSPIGRNFAQSGHPDFQLTTQIIAHVVNQHVWQFRVNGGNEKHFGREQSVTGLPDFSWCVIPKLHKMYQINTKCTECSQNIPNIHKIFQMAITYINILESEAQ